MADFLEGLFKSSYISRSSADAMRQRKAERRARNRERIRSNTAAARSGTHALTDETQAFVSGLPSKMRSAALAALTNPSYGGQGYYSPAGQRKVILDLKHDPRFARALSGASLVQEGKEKDIIQRAVNPLGWASNRATPEESAAERARYMAAAKSDIDSVQGERDAYNAALNSRGSLPSPIPETPTSMGREGARDPSVPGGWRPGSTFGFGQEPYEPGEPQRPRLPDYRLATRNQGPATSDYRFAGDPTELGYKGGNPLFAVFGGGRPHVPKPVDMESVLGSLRSDARSQAKRRDNMQQFRDVLFPDTPGSRIRSATRQAKLDNRTKSEVDELGRVFGSDQPDGPFPGGWGGPTYGEIDAAGPPRKKPYVPGPEDFIPEPGPSPLAEWKTPENIGTPQQQALNSLWSSGGLKNMPQMAWDAARILFGGEASPSPPPPEPKPTPPQQPSQSWADWLSESWHGKRPYQSPDLPSESPEPSRSSHTSGSYPVPAGPPTQDQMMRNAFQMGPTMMSGQPATSTLPDKPTTPTQPVIKPVARPAAPSQQPWQPPSMNWNRGLPAGPVQSSFVPFTPTPMTGPAPKKPQVAGPQPAPTASNPRPATAQNSMQPAFKSGSVDTQKVAEEHPSCVGFLRRCHELTKDGTLTKAAAAEVLEGVARANPEKWMPFLEATGAAAVPFDKQAFNMPSMPLSAPTLTETPGKVMDFLFKEPPSAKYMREHHPNAMTHDKLMPWMKYVSPAGGIGALGAAGNAARGGGLARGLAGVRNWVANPWQAAKGAFGWGAKAPGPAKYVAAPVAGAASGLGSMATSGTVLGASGALEGPDRVMQAGMDVAMPPPEVPQDLIQMAQGGPPSATASPKAVTPPSNVGVDAFEDLKQQGPEGASVAPAGPATAPQQPQTWFDQAKGWWDQLQQGWGNMGTGQKIGTGLGGALLTFGVPMLLSRKNRGLGTLLTLAGLASMGYGTGTAGQDGGSFLGNLFGEDSWLGGLFPQSPPVQGPSPVTAPPQLPQTDAAPPEPSAPLAEATTPTPEGGWVNSLADRFAGAESVDKFLELANSPNTHADQIASTLRSGWVPDALRTALKLGPGPASLAVDQLGASLGLTPEGILKTKEGLQRYFQLYGTASPAAGNI